MDYTWNSPGQNTGVGSLSLLQGIFPTQGSNPGLPHYRRILYQLSLKGSPRILSRWPIPSLGNLPDPGIEPESAALHMHSLPTELGGKPINYTYTYSMYMLNQFTYSDFDHKSLEIIVLVNSFQRSPLKTISSLGRPEIQNNVSIS